MPKKVRYIYSTSGEIVSLVTEDADGRLIRVDDPDFLNYIKTRESKKDTKIPESGKSEVKPGGATSFSLSEEPYCQSTMTEIPFLPEWAPWEGPVDMPEMVLGPGPTSIFEPEERKIGPCFPGPFDPKEPESGTFTIPVKVIPNVPKEQPEGDSVNHPSHYTSHPSGIECIEITRWYDFDIGNAIKYLWRHGLKHEEGMEDVDKSIEDLEKAIWYINDAIRTLKKKAEKEQKELKD